MFHKNLFSIKIEKKVSKLSCLNNHEKAKFKLFFKIQNYTLNSKSNTANQQDTFALQAKISKLKTTEKLFLEENFAQR